MNYLCVLATIVVATMAATIPKPAFVRSAAYLHDRKMHPDDDTLQPAPQHLHPRQLIESENDFWLTAAASYVQGQLNKKLNKGVAKNVIMFVGDGMSLATVTATRPYLGGEEKVLSFEAFPAVGMAKTYCVDSQVADSAATTTAFLSGVKANYGTIGVSARVARYNCTAQLDAAVRTSSIAEWAMDAGKVAGFVTTSAVTHASPAGLYAHSANRYWENDVELRERNCDPNIIDDIAEQLVLGNVGSRLRVIMGGGRQQLRNTTVTDEEGRPGLRSDGQDLIRAWIDGKRNENAQYVWNKADLVAVDAAETDYLLALFEDGSMRYHREVVTQGDEDKEPTLSEMTEKAIDLLSKNEQGFFLFVHAGKIDSAHHNSFARLAIDETAELVKAVDMARKKLPSDDTLIVVTSDHSHSMTISGYPYRGDDIFGTAGFTSQDNMSYMTLSYANGLGYAAHRNETGRIDVDTLDKSSDRYRFPAMVPLNSETHAGDDVAVYASGPWAHLFTGTYEQNVIPQLMAYASCIDGACN